MASPLVGRSPTCLACVRRITSASSSAAHATGNASISLTQVRGKKTSGRLKSQGVVIRLLKDVPQFGREGSIFRTDAGRMRNHFFPNRKAEYVTRARLAELGLTKDDIGERDYTFRLEVQEVERVFDDAVEAVAFGGLNAIEAPSDDMWARAEAKAKAEAAAAQAFQLEQLVPSRALELLESLVPQTVTFERHLVHIPASGKQAAGAATTSEPTKPESKLGEEAKEEETAQSEPEKPAPALTPLQAHRARLQAEAEKAKQEKQAAAEKAAAEKARMEEEERAAKKTPEELEKERKQKEREAEELLKIHGSVTLQNIAGVIKEKMLSDPEASRIHVQPDQITFVGLEEGVDKLDKIGTFEVEIRAHVGKAKVSPIRRTIKVVPH